MCLLLNEVVVRANASVPADVMASSSRCRISASMAIFKVIVRSRGKCQHNSVYGPLYEIIVSYGSMPVLQLL